MKNYQIMPDLTDEEYQALKTDIAERGVMVPIEFDTDGNVIDGHHRLRACQELGITDYPKVIRGGMDEVETLRQAWVLNTGRRHLTRNQINDAILKLKKDHPELSDRQIAYITGASHTTVANILKPERAGGQYCHLPKTEGADGRTYPSNAEEAQLQREAIRSNIVDHPEMSDRQIAKEMGVSHHTVAKQRDVVNKIVSVFNPSPRDTEALKDPDIQRRLSENDGMNVAGAIREQKRDQLVSHLESVEAKEAKAVAGVYDVIVIDPPWPMEKIERDVAPEQVKFDYPTMTIDEIKQLKIPTADDCHVFLWTTQKFLPDAFDILKTWGLKYVCCFVWHKNSGYKPFGLPTYNCEFALYAHKGSPKFVDEKQFWTCFNADTTGHSKKPEEFYDMVRRVTAGRRLDMFNRRKIDGFDVWGKEAADE